VELIHRRLGLSPEESRESLRKGRWPDALLGTRQRLLIIIDAHLLANGTLNELDELLSAGYPDNSLSWCVTGGTAQQMRAAAPSVRIEAIEPAHLTTACDVTVPPQAHLNELGADAVGDCWLSRVVAVGHFVDHHFKHIGPHFLELSALWAALALFEAPSDSAGGLLRVQGLELGLNRWGMGFGDRPMRELVSAALARSPIEWLPSVLAPPPPDMPRLRHPVLSTPLRIDDTTIAAWVSRLEQPATRDSYRATLDNLLRWRTRARIAPDDHRLEHLSQWGYWRASRGTARRTLARGLAIAQRFNTFLLTGVDVPTDVAYWRSERPAPIETDLDLAARLRKADRYERARNDDVAREFYGARPRLASAGARQLITVLGGREADMWALTDRLLIRYTDPALDPLRRISKTKARYIRNVSCLNGALVVLSTHIGWDQLPTELGYGSGSRARHAMDEWRRAGVWAELEVALRGRDALDVVDWSRASALRPLSS
jgi:hypothetical protein